MSRCLAGTVPTLPTSTANARTCSQNRDLQRYTVASKQRGTGCSPRHPSSRKGTCIAWRKRARIANEAAEQTGSLRVYAQQQKRRIEPLTRPFSEPFSAHLGSACWFSDTSSLLLSIVSSIGGLSLPRLKWTTVESRIPPLPPTKFRVHGVDTLTRFSKCGRWGRKLLPPSPESNIAVRGMQLCFATTACFATIRLNRLGKYSQGAAR